jgi:hypothetical protein
MPENKVLIRDLNKRHKEQPETELPAESRLEFIIGNNHFVVRIHQDQLEILKSNNDGAADSISIQPYVTNVIYIN